MKRLVLIALAAPLLRAAAQGSFDKLPVIEARVTELGIVRDTTLGLNLLPSGEAALSPRGNLVLYPTNKDLRIWNPATRTHTPVATGNIYSAVWSFAGDAIAFIRYSDESSTQAVWSMRVDPTTGHALEAPRRVSVSPTTGHSPQFSPDGKSIAFGRLNGRGVVTLVTLPTNGGPEKTLATGIRIRALRWEPDGAGIRYVAYADSQETKPLMHRVSVAGGSPTVVHDFGSTPLGDAPKMTADARFIELSGARDENSIVLADLSAKPVAKVAFPADVWTGDWSGAYRRAAVRERHPRGLRIVTLLDGKPRNLIDTTAEVSAPAWFPDGRRIAIIGMEAGKAFLITVNIDGSGLRKIALLARPQFPSDLAGWNHADLAVSPDGRYAMYLGDGRQSLELVELASGKQRTLARSKITVTTPMWRQDSKSIRYIFDGAVRSPNTTRSVHEVTLTGEDRVVRMLSFSEFPGAAVPLINENTISAFGAGSVNETLIPVDGGAPRVVVSSTVQGPGKFSPDGRTLVVRLGPPGVRDAKSVSKLTLVTLSDLSQREVDVPFMDAPLTPMFYHPDGAHMLIAGRETAHGPLNIYSLPLDGSKPRVVASMKTADRGTIFNLSPDGKSIVYVVAATPSASFVSLDFSAASKLGSGTK